MASTDKVTTKKSRKGSCWCSAPNCHNSKQKKPEIFFFVFLKTQQGEFSFKTSPIFIIINNFNVKMNFGCCIENRSKNGPLSQDSLIS